MRFVLILLLALALTLTWQTAVLADNSVGYAVDVAAQGDDDSGNNSSGDDEPECE